MVSAVSGLVEILFSVRNVSGGFIIVVLMCLGKSTIMLEYLCL